MVLNKYDHGPWDEITPATKVCSNDLCLKMDCGFPSSQLKTVWLQSIGSVAT